MNMIMNRAINIDINKDVNIETTKHIDMDKNVDINKSTCNEILHQSRYWDWCTRWPGGRYQTIDKEKDMKIIINIYVYKEVHTNKFPKVAIAKEIDKILNTGIDKKRTAEKSYILNFYIKTFIDLILNKYVDK